MQNDIDPRQNDLLLTAWAAGFIDGEGTIAITCHKDRYRKTQHTLVVCAGQTGATIPECLVRLQELFGGRVAIHKYYKDEPNRAPAWIWRAASRQASHVLEAMLPFLTVKREQAELAIEYRRMVVGKVGNKDGKHALAHEYMMRLRELRRLERTVEHKPPRVLRGHPRKLTDEQASELRRRYAAGGITYAQLGREFGISTSLACYINTTDSYYPRAAEVA